MTGRHGYEEQRRPERQNEYFIDGDGISREVIQADICRYLGNDALGHQGYFIRAYRNLTSEMIADLKADSARWEAEVSRSRPERASYPIDVRPPPGPSPPTYSAPPVQTYVDPYAQGSYGAAPSIPYTNAPPTYTSSHAPYVSSQAPYPPYTGASQPAVTASDAVPSYTYTTNTGYGYENNVRNNAPRYTGPAYESEPDYSPVTSGMSYSSTTVPDPRIGMDPRYTPEYSDRSSRTQPAREREARRPR